MKKTFGKQAMRIMAAALVMVLLMVPMASGEQSAWDCPECGRTGNLWNYCGNCAHPAPWTKEEGFDEEKAYDAVLKRLEEMDDSIGSLNGKLTNTLILNASSFVSGNNDYTCNWSDYETIIIAIGNYSNIYQAITCPTSEFSTTVSGHAICISYAGGPMWAIYQNGSAGITIIPPQSIQTATTIRVWGTGKK